jgi:hypothetical protein
MRKLDVPTPHFTDRIEQAQQLVASRDRTPALVDADRELLGNTLRSLRRVISERGGAEQLLHGEPHPGNVLTTKNGLLFIDLETCCRGPVEFDLAHAPEEVSEHYPGVDQDLLRECRILVLAMITTWRWDRGDQLPNGRQLGTEWLSQIRAALDRYRLDVRRWPRDNALARRLLDRQDDYLGFTTDFAVPVDTNAAERGIRMIKVRHKVSGCLRTLSGAETFCAIRSYLATAAKHRINFFTSLTMLAERQPWLPAAAWPDQLPS